MEMNEKRKKHNEIQKRYDQQPEVIARAKIYRQRPEVKVRQNATARTRRKKRKEMKENE